MRAFNQMLMAAVLLFSGGLIQAQGTVPGQWQDAFYLSPGCDTPVLAMAERTDGKVYIGGSFRFCDGVMVNRIALFDPVEKTFEPLIHDGVIGVNGNVRALAWADGDLFVGGALTMAGSREVNRVARWDGSAWHRLGSALSNGVTWSGGSATVQAMVWVAGDLYVAGLFDSAGTSPANNVARWSGGQWHLLGTAASNGVQASFSGGRVRAIQPLGSSLFVAGQFDSAGGAPANGLALWNGATWSSVGEGPSHGPGFDISPFRWISALLMDGSNLYVGGRFDFEDADGNICERCVMRWDGTSWLGLPFDAAFPSFTLNHVLDLAVHQGNLYAGVRYRDAVLGEEIDGFRRWTGSQWQSLGSPSTVVRASSLLATSNQGLFVGGEIGLVNGQPQNGIVRWSGTQFQAVGLPGGQGSEDLVRSIIEHDGQIHIAKGRRVARWDGAHWHYLPGTFNGNLLALASFQGQLYAGGFFTELDSEPALRIARFDGTEWFPVGGGIPDWDVSPVQFPGVISLVEDNGLLYVAGQFDQVGNVAANSIASWDGTSWGALSSLLGNGLERVLGQSVRPALANELMNHAGSIYVVGDFDLAGGAAARRIARWDGSGWFAVGGGFNSGFPYSLSWHDGELYAGGSGLTDQHDNTLGPLARLTGGQWQSASGFATTGQVYSLTSRGDWLYVGGLSLPWVDDDALGRWNGQQWQRFDSGVRYGSVNEMLVNQQGVSIGGDFKQAGPYASNFFGIFDFELGDVIFSDRFQPPEPRMGQMP